MKIVWGDLGGRGYLLDMALSWVFPYDMPLWGRLEAIASRSQAIASRLEAIARLVGRRPSLV